MDFRDAQALREIQRFKNHERAAFFAWPRGREAFCGWVMSLDSLAESENVYSESAEACPAPISANSDHVNYCGQAYLAPAYPDPREYLLLSLVEFRARFSLGSGRDGLRHGAAVHGVALLRLMESADD